MWRWRLDPAAVKSFYFHWELGVTFGRRQIKVRALTARILKEIAIYSEPGNRRLGLRITRISGPRGQIRFATTTQAPSDFTFRLDPGVLWLSARRRAYLKAHHSRTVTGLFEVRTVAGAVYREAVKVTL